MYRKQQHQTNIENLTRLFRTWGLKRMKRIEQLAGQRGCYVFLMKIPGICIQVGALGRIRFPAGLFGYVGSSNGRSSTLAKRLARHVKRKKARHWHIDYVTSHPGVMPVTTYVAYRTSLTEYRLAQRFAQHFPVVKRFGNSDFKDKTPGHLFFLQPQMAMAMNQLYPNLYSPCELGTPKGR